MFLWPGTVRAESVESAQKWAQNRSSSAQLDRQCVVEWDGKNRLMPSYWRKRNKILTEVLCRVDMQACLKYFDELSRLSNTNAKVTNEVVSQLAALPEGQPVEPVDPSLVMMTSEEVQEYIKNVAESAAEEVQLVSDAAGVAAESASDLERRAGSVVGGAAVNLGERVVSRTSQDIGQRTLQAIQSNAISELRDRTLDRLAYQYRHAIEGYAKYALSAGSIAAAGAAGVYGAAYRYIVIPTITIGLTDYATSKLKGKIPVYQIPCNDTQSLTDATYVNTATLAIDANNPVDKIQYLDAQKKPIGDTCVASPNYSPFMHVLLNNKSMSSDRDFLANYLADASGLCTQVHGLYSKYKAVDQMSLKVTSCSEDEMRIQPQPSSSIQRFLGSEIIFKGDFSAGEPISLGNAYFFGDKKENPQIHRSRLDGMNFPISSLNFSSGQLCIPKGRADSCYDQGGPNPLEKRREQFIQRIKRLRRALSKKRGIIAAKKSRHGAKYSDRELRKINGQISKILRRIEEQESLLRHFEKSSQSQGAAFSKLMERKEKACMARLDPEKSTSCLSVNTEAKLDLATRASSSQRFERLLSARQMLGNIHALNSRFVEAGLCCQSKLRGSYGSARFARQCERYFPDMKRDQKIMEETVQ